MNNDPSRAIYCCPSCRSLPCSCVREHKPLEIQTFTCKLCVGEVFYTLNKLQEHRLAFHALKPVSLGVNGYREVKR